MDASGTPALIPGQLLLSLVGPLRLRCDGREIRLRSRKARAVLGYLALSESGEESRERLVGLLWSESSEKRARDALRQVLHELRESLEEAGFQGLRTDRLSVALAPGSISTDVHAMLRAVEAGMAPGLLLDTAELGEAVLQGLDDLDPAFRVWLLTTRQALLDRLTRSLEPAMRRADLPVEARQNLARAMLRLDPTHEEACRILMRCLAEAGDTSAALRVYNALFNLLDAEFDTEPTSATLKLLAEIKLGRLEPSAAAPGASPPQPQSAARIALLVEPFQLNGVPPDQQHLTQGFRHDLMACLVRFREWFVADGYALPPAEQIGHRVSARYRIRTTAYRAGEGIRLTMILAEESGIWVWTESADLTLDGWYEMQSRIVRHIAVSLNLQISAARLNRLAAEPDVSLAAFDQWLRGQAMILRFSAQDWARAEALFSECIAQTPQFSPPYSGLVQMDNAVHIVHPGVRRERAREVRSLERARRAVQLDPMDSRAQLCLGWSLAMCNQHAQADVHMRLARDLNQYDSWTLISTALFHSFRGQHDAAAKLAGLALDATLQPSATHWAYQVSIAYLRGDDEAALEACDLAQDRIHTLPAWRAASLARLGRRDEAVAAAQRFLRGIRGNWHGTTEPDDAEITRWLLHLYPMRNPAEWNRLRDGVAMAGLPVAGLRHGDW